jgi:peroxiredoxin
MAPAFALPAGTGKTVRLWDYKQRKAAVIYFLGGSEVALLGQLRSDAPVYREAGAELLVISAQTAARVTELTAELGLDYPLLADPDQAVHTRYIQLTYPQYNPQEVREKPLALFIADRFGAVNRYATTTDPNKLPSQTEILEVLEFLGNLCNP